VVASGRAARLRSDLIPLYALAAAVLCAAGGWYLLKETAARLKALASRLVNIAADFLAEALVVVFDLVFLLLEVHRFPARIRGGFPPDQNFALTRPLARLMAEA
jgi:predicted PurR-regulated permease PerM